MWFSALQVHIKLFSGGYSLQIIFYRPEAKLYLLTEEKFEYQTIEI